MTRFNAEGCRACAIGPKSGRPVWLDEGELAAFKAPVLRESAAGCKRP